MSNRLNRAAWLWVGLLISMPLATGTAKDIRLDMRVSPTFQAIELDIDANRTD